jgi:hypothetical protein
MPAPVHVVEPRPVPVAETYAAAPVAESRPPVERAPEAAVHAEPPRVNPKEYLATAGLQMVETKPGAAAVPPPVEDAKLGRPRRQRSEAPAEEPLVQIETHK